MQGSLSTYQKLWTPSSTIPSYYLAKTEPLKEKANILLEEGLKKKIRLIGALRN